MKLDSPNANMLKLGGRIAGLFCLACVFLGCVGCQSNSDVSVSTDQGNPRELVESLGVGAFATRRAGQLSETDTNLDEQPKPVASAAFQKAKITGAGSENSGYHSKAASVPKGPILESAETQVHSLGDILATNHDIVVTTEPLPLEPSVRLPILDKPAMADELISVNFDQVDIRMMLKSIGEITGINFVVDESVRGTVTVMSPTKIRLGDVYKVLESVLEVKGYAAVPAGDLVKVVPKAKAVRHNLQVRIGSNPLEIPQSDSFVTQIIPLKYADVAEVSNLIKPLLATDSYMSIYPRTNSILITDVSSNIHHIAKIIQTLDVAGSKEQVTVIRLNYASAQVLSEQITRIMQKSKASSSQTGRNRSTSQIKTGIKILPDARTNSLIVVANAQDTEMIERLARQLDIQRPRGTNNVHVVYLKNAPAKETAQSLTAALTDLRIAGALEASLHVRVTADEGTNALIITTSAQDYEVIAEIIEKLDIVREQVLVEMLVMEVTKEGLKEIGVDWATLDEAVADSVRFFGATNFGPRVDFASGDLEGLSIGAWKKTGSTTSTASLITALEKETGVNILSTPHIMTSNHQKASIIVGENRPFVTVSRITESDPLTPTVIKSYEYKDVGISLEITPHISQGGLVRLEIDSEFTKLVESTSSSDTPTTAKRQAQTVVSMNSGSTIVIGGMIRDDKTTIEMKVPLLGDFPLLGGLFRYKKDQLQKTNLLIFITPYVMTNQQDLEDITDKKRDEMKQEIEELLKNTAEEEN